MSSKYLKQNTINVHHDKENHEFYVPLTNGRISVKYEAEENVWKFTSVDIPQEARRFHIGPRLLEYAIETAKAEKLKILPACAYAQTYLARNPRFQSLLPS